MGITTIKIKNNSTRNIEWIVRFPDDYVPESLIPRRIRPGEFYVPYSGTTTCNKTGSPIKYFAGAERYSAFSLQSRIILKKKEASNDS